MGKLRHQAFLIARIVPDGGSRPQWRCVGGFQHKWGHQWGPAVAPLLAVHRFIALIKQKENAEIIREELRAIDSSRSGSFRNFEAPLSTQDVPCPFSVSLLGISWTVDLMPGAMYLDGRAVEQALLPAYVGSWQGGTCVIRRKSCRSCIMDSTLR